MNIETCLSHCCKRHGCKYGHNNCPVEVGTHEQKYPCEFCEDDPEPLFDENEKYTELGKEVLDKFTDQLQPLFSKYKETMTTREIHMMIIEASFDLAIKQRL